MRLSLDQHHCECPARRRLRGTKSSRVLSGRECPICEMLATQISRFGNHALFRLK